jgi:hypothetical protein
MDGYTIGPAVDFDPFAKPKKTGQKYTLGAPVDFDPFADDDSAAQVPNELMAAHDQQDLVRREPLQRRMMPNTHQNRTDGLTAPLSTPLAPWRTFTGQPLRAWAVALAALQALLRARQA